MADVGWSAYALAMFTPEQLRAAAGGFENDSSGAVTYEPIDENTYYIKPAAVNTGLGLRITGPGIPVGGYDPNVPAEDKKLRELGWRFEAGKWIAPGSLGTAATADGVAVSSGNKGVGVSSVVSVSTIAGSSVLGVTVPGAPPVLLPRWVGGAIGHVVRSGGTRPESGGTLRIIKGEGHKYSWTRVVR